MSTSQNISADANIPLKVIIDSNVLVGLLNPLDHWHQHSIAFSEALNSSNVHLVYLDCVMSEVTSVVVRRLFEKQKPDEIERFFDSLTTFLPEDHITWAFSAVPRLYTDVITLIRKTQGQLNFHDALIALICREQQIKFIASYDTDFDQITWLSRIANPQDLETYIPASTS